jgi:manganese/iron transport system permease protein/iron/zinc/copper transport system permease protein
MAQSLYDVIVMPWTQTFFQKAFIGGSMIAIVCGVVGCLVILQRMAFLGDALSHAMIAGVGCGYLFMKSIFGVEAYTPAMLLGSLIAAIITVLMIGIVSRLSRIKEDSAIGIVYTGIFAAGVVLVSIFRDDIHIDLMHFIMGDVLAINDQDLWVAAFVASVVISIIILFFRYFQLVTFDKVMAMSIGVSIALVEYTLTVCMSLIVVSAVSMVGVILVVGLLITPAASAYLLTDRLQKMMVLAALFGVTSILGGLYLSVWLDSAGGGAIMVFCTLQFFVVLILAPRYGLLSAWRRRLRFVPQELMDDILRFMLRFFPASASLTSIHKEISRPRAEVDRALNRLAHDGFIGLAEGGAHLTPSGQEKATHLQRAHRLWESYLLHTGVPQEEIHRKAHYLEHLNEEPSITYIDDLLGHPIRDPHGSLIPGALTASSSSQAVSLSLLREGARARVVAIDSLSIGVAAGLRPNELVVVGPRRDQERIWVILRENGEELELDHAAADAIKVALQQQ